MKMKTTNLAVYAGQRVHFNLTISPAGHEAPVGALVIPGAEPMAMEVSGDQLVTPELAPGLYLYEIRCQGVTVLSGHVNVYPSPLSEQPGTVTLSGTADISGPLVQCEVSLGETGPAGADGLSAYEIWLAAGNSGTEEEFLASLVGPQGIQGPQGETGPAPSHEWQGTSLRFANPDGTWGDLVNLQGPQGEAGTGGGGTITIDDTPKSGSSNAVSSGGVYNCLNSYNVALGQGAYPLPSSYNCSVSIGTYANASGFASTAIGADAKSLADNAIALGVGTVAEAASSCALGAGGYIADTGVTVLNAGGEITDGKSTQLYLIPAGSTMASNYTNGEAGLGYVVLDHLSGSVVARGTIPLAAICTQHTSDFSPTNVTSITGY